MITLLRILRTLDEAQPIEQTGFRKGFCCMDHIQTVPRGNEITVTHSQQPPCSN
ncbi:hypothetical protein KIN20_036931 [Parelaphostrongylus tenuis]|uniref:Uncharacterized protein n=1 Tax=Parelaphostrongylus tenuis TaxID=148309 RepID=A0AAD5RDP0_PARTN|nr:hypothetical protein KIN20_036931 [Parelaphostrongylus tenuis]